jgi:hypothetical protein
MLTHHRGDDSPRAQRGNRETHVPVYENYRGYTPPIAVAKHVANYLRSIPPQYLMGLDSLVLTNELALSAKSRKRRFPRNSNADLRVGGLYHRRSTNQAAWIELFIDNIIGSTPPLLLRIGVFRDLRIAPRVFHEVGHHIDLSSVVPNSNAEAAVKMWKKRLLGCYLRRRYWYVLPVLWPLAVLYRGLKLLPFYRDGS